MPEGSGYISWTWTKGSGSGWQGEHTFQTAGPMTWVSRAATSKWNIQWRRWEEGWSRKWSNHKQADELKAVVAGVRRMKTLPAMPSGCDESGHGNIPISQDEGPEPIRCKVLELLRARYPRTALTSAPRRNASFYKGLWFWFLWSQAGEERCLDEGLIQLQPARWKNQLERQFAAIRGAGSPCSALKTCWGGLLWIRAVAEGPPTGIATENRLVLWLALWLADNSLSASERADTFPPDKRRIINL